MALKIIAWIWTVTVALVLTGAVVLFVSAEIDAGVHCAKGTFHSGECKDIRTVQLVMTFVGGVAAVLLAIQVLLHLWRRKRSG